MALTQISTAGVKDDAVTSGKIPADAVGSSEIAANAVGSSELADNAVDTAAIADDAVTNAKLASNCITNSEIAGNSIDGDKISNTSITGVKLVNGAINEARLGNGSVTTDKIADTAVTLAKLEHGTSSNNGKFLRANNGADPTFETVTGTTINNNADNRVITGSGTANTLEGEGNLTFDGTTLSHGTGGLTNAQKLVIQGSNNSSGDALTLNNWGNSDGDYWTLGVNMTANSGGSFSKTDTNIRCAGINIDGRMGRIIFNASETSSSTINDAHTFTRDGGYAPNGNISFANGKGIDFSAQTGTGGGAGQSIESELLNHYEEGKLNATAISSGLTFTTGGSTNKNLHYVRIGNFVNVSGYLEVSSFTSNSTGIQIQMPFTSAPNSSDYYTRGVGATMASQINLPSTAYLTAYVGGGENYMRFYYTQDTASYHQMVNSDLTSNSGIYFSVTYGVQ